MKYPWSEKTTNTNEQKHHGYLFYLKHKFRTNEKNSLFPACNNVVHIK